MRWEGEAAFMVCDAMILGTDAARTNPGLSSLPVIKVGMSMP